MATAIPTLGAAERKIIAKELQRLRGILVAIDQLEQCGIDCSNSRFDVQALWKNYQDKLKYIYQESPEQPPWQEPSQNTLQSVSSSTK